MAYELKGKIEVLGETIQVTEKFKKREFVVLVEGTYPEYIKLQLMQDKCDLLNSFKVGDSVNVSFNLKGKPFESKKTGEMMYFTNLDAWRIQADNGAAQQQPQDLATQEASNDLPF